MTDEEIIEEAQALYANDEILIQQMSVDGPPLSEIVDRVPYGAWVMAWVWVRIDDEESP